MELRSGRRLVPQQVGGGDDRISALPDEVLLQILAALGSTAEAARTTILARRWTGLWPELHVLAQALRGGDPAAGVAALRDMLSGWGGAGGGRRPDFSRLVIHVPRRRVDAAEVTSLLRAAERHAPEELTVVVAGAIIDDGDGGDDDRRRTFELPCFARATSVELQIWRLGFTLPPAGEFARLERLALSLCCVDPSVFLHRCPRLRNLVMDCYWELEAASIRSESLEDVVIKDLPLTVPRGTTRRVDVVAPLLKKFKLISCGNRDLVVKFSAESNVIENLSFKYCSLSSCSVGFGYWRLKSLDMGVESSSELLEDGQVNLVRVLSLVIMVPMIGYHANAKRSFKAEIACLPTNSFSVVKLEVPRLDGDVTGSLVFHLLSIVSGVQWLQLVLHRIMRPHSGTDIKVDEDISFTQLEEVGIQGFDVTNDYQYLDFLKLLFKYAPVLKIVRITLSPGVSQSHWGYQKLCDIFQENAPVQSFVNGLIEEFEVNLPQAHAM
ncbi:unnamed protein product [Urochloa decumbens]|uniref:FBD domain-containing protein n=1 Tax=Urochloa decumbens TaxID=240449 RepID=A0ABC9GNS6_9POAL